MRLDVSGGWYDAGDHGKYVVNGGISTWELLSTYERARHARTGQTDKLGDGTLAIPESGNKVPDILDEARWELEFLLKMQVPDGKPLAGMAHHKMHDEQWTGLPLLPSDDPQKRELHPPSTAATLNLAATAAQAAACTAPTTSRSPPRPWPPHARPGRRRSPTPTATPPRATASAAAPTPTATSPTTSTGRRPSCTSPPGTSSSRSTS